MSVGSCVMKKTPTPLERISRMVWVTDSKNPLLASVNSRCASSKKNANVGLSGSPTSGSSSNSSASTHIRNVENSAGLVATDGSDMTVTMPLPSGVVRSRSRTSNPGSPKNTSPPSPSSSETLRCNTPTVALDRPPRFLRSALPGPTR